ncbi:TniQ family protein [Streptomyces sp. NBC_00464]|uniref:TniQ family protein n=1 Tax=Streptomyces sp. NBC_00464 TaxID=2975751 RepID=UPI002E19DEAE
MLTIRAGTHRARGPATVGWNMTPSSRYCPPCLRGNGSPIQNTLGGAWQLRWHLPIVFACTRHKSLLEYECPSCLLPLNNPERRRVALIKQPNIDGLHPLQCRNPEISPGGNPIPGTGPVCGARLDHIDSHRNSPFTLEDLQLLLDLQKRIDGRLNPPVNSAHASPAADTYFHDLITATRLIKISWPTGHRLLPTSTLAAIVNAHIAPFLSSYSQDQGATIAGVRTAPTDPATSGALLLAADNLITERDVWTLAEKVGPLSAETYRRSKPYASKIAQEPGISKEFARAMSPRDPNSRKTNILYRKLRHNYTFTIAQVPAYLPRSWYLTHFAKLRAQLPNITYRDDRLLRRGAAFRLAELASGQTWSDCAMSLGVSPGVGANAQRMLGHRLTDARLWPLFTHIVEEIADELDAQKDRIDYANRRLRMGSWCMPDTDRDRLFDSLHRLERLRTQMVPRFMSIVVWSDVTRGEPSRSPFAVAVRSAVGTQALTTLIGHFHEANLGHGQRFRLRQRLALYATYLARSCDQDEKLSVDMDVVVAQEADAYSPRAPDPLA